MEWLGWGIAGVAVGVQAWARRRDNESLDELAEEVAMRHERVFRAQIGGFGVALALFVLLGRGPVALSVALSLLGAQALGTALWRAQLPGTPGLRRWIGVELAASWATYVGVGLILWG